MTSSLRFTLRMSEIFRSTHACSLVRQLIHISYDLFRPFGWMVAFLGILFLLAKRRTALILQLRSV